MIRTCCLVLCLALTACEGPLRARPDTVRIDVPGVESKVVWPLFMWWLDDAVAFRPESDGVLQAPWLARLDGTPPEPTTRETLQPWNLVRDPETGHTPWLATQSLVPGQLTLHRVAGGAPLVIDNVLVAPTRPDPCELVISADGKKGTLWRGPSCDSLSPVATALAVSQVVSPQWNGSLLDPTVADVVLTAVVESQKNHLSLDAGHTLVLAAEGGLEGLYDVAPDGSYELLVPKVLATYDNLPGETTPELSSSEIENLGYTWRVCRDGRCWLLYTRRVEYRTTSTGGITHDRWPFIMPLDTRRETALPSKYAAWNSSHPPDAHLVSWAAQNPVTDASQQGHLWDPSSGQHTSCDGLTIQFLSGGQRSSDGGISVYQGAPKASRGITVHSATTGACTTIAHDVWWTEGVPFIVESSTWYHDLRRGAELSPAATRLAWVNGRTELWVADGDGANPRKLMSGRWFEHPTFAGNEDQLLVEHASFAHGQVLSLIDISGDAPVEHRLAEGVFGTWRRNGRSVIAGTDHDPASQTGNLTLLDLDRRHRLTLELNVDRYEAEDGAVAYHVADRSSFHGWWVRRFP